MMYEFTPDEWQKILAFVNDDNNDVLSTDIPQRFINMSAAFSSRLYRAYGAEKRRSNSSERTIARMRARLEGRVADGQFVELDFDSLELALCIVYLLKERDAMYSRARVQYLLYEAYSRWLADKSERLTKEHPVAQEWGPHFWHISKTCGLVPPTTSIDDFRRVAEQKGGDGVVAFLRNVVNKYVDWSDDELKKSFLQSVPFKNAKAKVDSTDPNLRKWGREIKDADIFAWKK